MVSFVRQKLAMADLTEHQANEENLKINDDRVTKTTSVKDAEDDLDQSDGLQTCPIDGNTQEAGDTIGTPPAVGALPVWGRLYPRGRGFSYTELREDSYVFGRGTEKDGVNITFDLLAVGKKNAQVISKKHFKIVREPGNHGLHPVLYDLSSNGTFVNGEKVGKDKRIALTHEAEIALALAKNNFFVYMEGPLTKNSEYPEEIQNNFIVSKVLGSGAMGLVRLAFKRQNMERFAIKIIQKSKFSIHGKHQIDTSKQIEREINILKGIEHPCIIRIFNAFDSPTAAFILLELVDGGELFDKIINYKPNSRLPEKLAKLYFYQCLLAIEYLHGRGITHRDLKPENILLLSENDHTLVKVTDFGLSKFIDSETMLKTFCGTPNYLAPEILKSHGTGSYTEAIDLWSLGVILFVSLSGYPPFSSDYKDQELNKQILAGNYHYFDKEWQGINEDAIEVVKNLLVVDPKKRMTVGEALNSKWLQDPWVKKTTDQLIEEAMRPPQQMTQLRVSPRKRPADPEAMEVDSNLPARKR